MDTQFKEKFKIFLTEYDEEKINRIWDEQSTIFKNFWNERIMSGKSELDDAEIDQVVRILDRHGKGNTKGSQAVAITKTPQGVWRRLFRDIRKNKNLNTVTNQLFHASSDDKKIELINKLYKSNEGQKNGLTGGSGNVINAMLFVYSPKEHLSVISFNDRKKIIDHFEFKGIDEINNDTPGQKFVLSNTSIVNGFRNMGITNSTRAISEFLYSPYFKDNWKFDEKPHPAQKFMPVSEVDEEIENANKTNPSFSMEDELENFLITNWEITELGKKYDLLIEDGELVSQQYQTGIGRIDILAIEKKTKKYIVIELKRGKTSDVTIGQLARYMAWLEEHRTNGEKTKGIIIALEYDEKLHYASKKIPDVEVYVYRIKFFLEEHRKSK